MRNCHGLCYWNQNLHFLGLMRRSNVDCVRLSSGLIFRHGKEQKVQPCGWCSGRSLWICPVWHEFLVCGLLPLASICCTSKSKISKSYFTHRQSLAQSNDHIFPPHSLAVSCDSLLIGSSGVPTGRETKW